MVYSWGYKKWRKPKYRSRKYRQRRIRYRTRRSSRRRRSRFRRSRRRRPTVSNLWEVNPTYQRKCTIRGVMPGLVLGRQKATYEDSTAPSGSTWPSDIEGGYTNYEDKPWNFCPEARFWVGSTTSSWWTFDSKVQLLTGGWAVGGMSLKQLYEEHGYHKNRWSASNCGFDVAKYRGTVMYLQQHKFLDYMFYWDAEYSSLSHFIKHEKLHPLDLLTHPQTIIVKSKDRAGPRRTRKVYIPRPAWWPSGWSNMSDIANTGLFCWFIMFIDLDNPWLGKHQNPYDEAHGAWWRSMKWYDKFIEYVQSDNDSTTYSFRKSQYKNGDMRCVRDGPFFLKSWKVEHADYTYPQVTLFYKSYWTWGGRTLSIKKICDPKKPLDFTD